jgi:hypothetical protein
VYLSIFQSSSVVLHSTSLSRQKDIRLGLSTGGYYTRSLYFDVMVDPRGVMFF